MPAASSGVTVISAFSNGAYDALSNANLTVVAAELDTVTETAFEVAAESAAA